MYDLDKDYSQENYNAFEERMDNYKRTKDANVRRVMSKFADRAEVGYDKYGVTTERKDIDLLGWLTHLQEELMDACIYVEKIKQEVK